MKLLTRYLVRELLVPLGLWVAFIFLLLVVLQFLKSTEVLLGSAASAWATSARALWRRRGARG